ncbi:hypothetical protein [Streptomyces camelliae]|uniref:hypothetical protein n=1 Tax=Streptomyces camelliae TaxID=3004093 RepID=UPI002FD869BB
MRFTLAEARRRVAGTDRAALTAELDEHGGAPTGPLLTPAECAQPAALYDRPVRAGLTGSDTRTPPGPAYPRYTSRRLMRTAPFASPG